MRLLQDISLTDGGAERVLRSALSTNRFDEVLVGLGFLDGLNPRVSQVCLSPKKTWAVVEHAQVLHELFLRALEHPILDGSSMVFHHHAGLLFRHSKRPGIYMHTVTRSLWEPEKVPWEIPALDDIRDEMAQRECESVEDAAILACNSNFTANRIEGVFGRRPSILEPSVDLWKVDMSPIENFPLNGEYVLYTGRLAQGKGLELFLEASHLMSLQFVVAGEGRLSQTLTEDQTKGVLFLGRVPDSELRWLISHASVVVSPAVEDFGISSVESICEGTPCVVPDFGGQMDHVDSSVAATFPPAGTPSDLALAIELALRTRIPTATVETYRRRFSFERFSKGMDVVLDAICISS